MTTKQRTFKVDRGNTAYTATLAKGVVTVRIKDNGAQGNSAICGTYDPEKHLWYNDNGRKVIPCSIKNQVEKIFKPLDITIAEQKAKKERAKSAI